VLFNSFEYFVFFSFCLVAACLLAGLPRLRVGFLLVASFYFYFSNNHWQILLLLFAVTVDYFVCLRMQDERSPTQRKLLLCVSLLSNLGLLGFFKYANFLGESFHELAAAFGFRLDWVDLHVLLPVGISFYTFEALSYTIDVYRGEIRAERKWSRIAFMVSFFPHLIAGPIVRARNFFPQIYDPKPLTRDRLERALFLIAGGLFKKMILADTLALFADNAFDHTPSIGWLGAWIGVYAFSFQIFFDFSGYTDVALGSALLLGYDLPQNFRRPYIATSITDFWRRWHMTLSSWLRDYLYIPLGGSRMPSKLGVYRNLILTMFLGGLWHGAAWHFAIWGVLHGLALSVERALGVRPPSAEAKPAEAVGWRLLKGALVFQLVTFLWIPFRARNLGDTWRLMEQMFSFRAPVGITNGMVLAALTILLSWAFQAFAELTPAEGPIHNAWLPLKAVAYSGVIVGVLVASSAAPRAFIYFQF
jgi:alginate O-acetyltransferase complex protein AlgI